MLNEQVKNHKRLRRMSNIIGKSRSIVKPKSIPKSKSQIQVPNPSPKSKSQILNPKSKGKGMGLGLTL